MVSGRERFACSSGDRKQARLTNRRPRFHSKYPSPVRFFQDRSEFSFFHPFEHTEVQMVMYYRDMESASLRSSSKRFEFRINHSLGEMCLLFCHPAV